MKSEAVLLVWLFLVTTHDFRKRRVPNWLVLLGAALALAALALGVQPFDSTWTQALLGAVVGFGFLLLFYAVGLMGAGDVKFAGALGLWAGLQAFVPIWIIASLLAAVHSLMWLGLRRWALFPRLFLMLSGQQAVPAGDTGSRKRARVIPYAAYLAIATVVWMVWGRQG